MISYSIDTIKSLTVSDSVNTTQGFFDNRIVEGITIAVCGGLILTFIYWVIKKFINRKLLKIKVNYLRCYKTTYNKIDYTIINLSIINNNSYDINNVEFKSKPGYDSVGTILSNAENINGSVIGGFKLIPNSFSKRSNVVPANDKIERDLIFKTHNQIEKIEFEYLDKKQKISIKKIEEFKDFNKK